MPRLDLKTCRNCGGHASNVGVLSHTRLCATCSISLLSENVHGISTHTGPAFSRWRRSLAASVGAVLLDDLPATGTDSR